ncbi:MAG: acyltransferase family protein [Proteobacteria bacterium]|nr:acyltransferase family protein [Pseudomonadota bacterium]
MWRRLLNRRIRKRVTEIALPWGPFGIDPYGIDQDYVAFAMGCIEPMYRKYFNLQTVGIEHVPASGRAMVIGNHSGGLPFDATMVLGSLFFEMEPPRLAHGMVEKMAQEWPVASPLFSRVGQLTGLPEHAIRLLEDDRVLMVFPEGVRGLGKLHSEKYELKRFGTGFARIALKTGAPIVPFGLIGMEEAYPVVSRLEPLSKILNVPYLPVPAHGVPWPKPVDLQLRFGEPIRLEGDGNESDEVIEAHVRTVMDAVAGLLAAGRAER